MVLRITTIITIGFVMGMASTRERKRTEEPVVYQEACLGFSRPEAERMMPVKRNQYSAKYPVYCLGVNIPKSINFSMETIQREGNVWEDDSGDELKIGPTSIDFDTSYWHSAKNYLRNLFGNKRRSNIQHSLAEGGPEVKPEVLEKSTDKLAADLEILETLKKIVEEKLQDYLKEENIMIKE